MMICKNTFNVSKYLGLAYDECDDDITGDINDDGTYERDEGQEVNDEREKIHYNTAF